MNTNTYQPASPQQRKSMAMVAYILMLLAPLWFLGAGHFYQESREAANSWPAADATVCSFKAESDSDGTIYYPRFQFTAANGRSYEVQSNHGSSSPDCKVGDVIPILYPEAAPEKAVENSFFSLYFSAIVLAIMGTSSFFMGAFVLFLSRRTDLKLADNDRVD